MSRVAAGPIGVVIVAPALGRLAGGQEVQGDQLAREWCGDPDVRAVLVESNPSLPASLAWFEEIPALRTILRLPSRAAKTWRAMRRADVVHVFAGAHSSFLLGTLPAVGAAMLRGLPTIVHYHSPRAEEHLEASPLARAVLRRCRAVVVPSSYLQPAFARHGISTLAIPNVVDTSRFPLRSDGGVGVTLLCARNFQKHYAVDDVIRAFSLVKRELPESRLVLAGSGPEEGALRALVRSLGLADVTFAGATSRDEMGRLLATASVMLNASRIDNMPVSILEAFAAGVPVVTTSAGGIPTFARHDDTALLAEPGDVKSLASHVLRIHRDPATAQRLIAAARTEADKCTWEVVRPAWLVLYRRLTASPSSSVR